MRLNVTRVLTCSMTFAAIALLTLAGVMSSVPAFAQSDILLQLEQCGEIPDDSVRLACYDRLMVIESETSAAGNAESDSPPPILATVSNEAGEPAAVVDAAAPADAVVPQVPATAPAVREEEAVAMAVPEADDPELISVVSVRRNLSGLAVFETADGELWVQTDISNRRYPPVPFAARIERALLRGYFLRVQDGGFRVRVRKTR